MFTSLKCMRGVQFGIKVEFTADWSVLSARLTLLGWKRHVNLHWAVKDCIIEVRYT